MAVVPAANAIRRLRAAKNHPVRRDRVVGQLENPLHWMVAKLLEIEDWVSLMD